MKKAIVHISAPYDDAMKKKIMEAFSSTDNETDFEFIEDLGLRGGFIAYVDGKAYDCSLSGRLEKIRSSMTGKED